MNLNQAESLKVDKGVEASESYEQEIRGKLSDSSDVWSWT